MSIQKRGLGEQGFDVLGKFMSSPQSAAANTNENKNDENSNISPENMLLHIDVDMIIPNKEQPRNIFNDETINELADSIKSVGVLSPVIVSKQGEYYKLIAGERRYRAARIAGLKEIPATLTTSDDIHCFEISLIENIQREDLNPVDEALAYKKFKDNFNFTDEQISEKTGKNRATITNSLRLLKLDERVLDFLRKSLLTAGHARALITVENADMQFELAEKIIDESLSVRQTEELVKELPKNNDKQNENKIKTSDTEIYSEFSEKLKNILSTKVKIKNNNRNGRGKIEIEYTSVEDLDRIILLFNQIESGDNYNE